jgi:hypothetical protein
MTGPPSALMIDSVKALQAPFRPPSRESTRPWSETLEECVRQVGGPHITVRRVGTGLALDGSGDRELHSRGTVAVAPLRRRLAVLRGPLRRAAGEAPESGISTGRTCARATPPAKTSGCCAA